MQVETVVNQWYFYFLVPVACIVALIIYWMDYILTVSYTHLFRSPSSAAVFCIPPKLLSVLAFEIDQQPETNCAYNTNKPIQRGTTGCKVSKGRANRLAQSDELMCKIVTRRPPVGCPQLEERPQDEQIGNVRNEIFSDLICPCLLYTSPNTHWRGRSAGWVS